MHRFLENAATVFLGGVMARRARKALAAKPGFLQQIPRAVREGTVNELMVSHQIPMSQRDAAYGFATVIASVQERFAFRAHAFEKLGTLARERPVIAREYAKTVARHLALPVTHPTVRAEEQAFLQGRIKLHNSTPKA